MDNLIKSLGVELVSGIVFYLIGYFIGAMIIAIMVSVVTLTILNKEDI